MTPPDADPLVRAERWLAYWRDNRPAVFLTPVCDDAATVVSDLVQEVRTWRDRQQNLDMSMTADEAAEMRQEVRDLRARGEAKDATIMAVVHTIGGVVEGVLTHRGNFLQRVRQLVTAEAHLKDWITAAECTATRSLANLARADAANAHLEAQTATLRELSEEMRHEIGAGDSTHGVPKWKVADWRDRLDALCARPARHL